MGKRRRPRHQEHKSHASIHVVKKKKIALICVVLAVVTIVTYWPVLDADFVHYDDSEYVTENQYVLDGLTLDGVKWAFRMDGYAANWHPLTWLSHMLDCELFGSNAGLHHLTNLIIHTTSTILLVLVLVSMTGRFWASAFVAAAFALHPLHVESVAWVAERKDVLSGLFWVLTIGCYLRYTRTRSKGSYSLVLVVFGLGLMAKPMLVTLPFVLLLLDYWPLNRIESIPTISRFRTVRPLVIEKIPLFFLSMASCLATYIAQQAGGAVKTIGQIPLDARLSNAMVSYVAYMVKMVWPVGLAVLYPIKHTPLWQSVLAFLVLAAITVAAVFWLRRRRYFAVGWLWYIGTLVPVIGLMQVGVQSHADRYTYIPLTGLFMIVACVVGDFCRRRPSLRFVSGFAAVLLTGGMFVGTRHQLGYWKDSPSLFRRAIQVTENNLTMHYSLGVVLAEVGQRDEAIGCYRRALEINPDYAEAHNSLGVVLAEVGQRDEAIGCYHRALEINPDYAEAHNNLGAELAKAGQLDEAMVHYRRALQINPDYAEVYNNLGTELAKVGQLDEAMGHFRRALQINPDYAKAHTNLGIALAKAGQRDEAMVHYRRALQINPDDNQAHFALGIAFTITGQLNEAINHYRRVVESQPDHLPGINNLAWILATAADPKLRSPAEAVSFAEKGCELTAHENTTLLDTLAVAYASADRFDEAVSTAEKALQQAETAGNENLAQEIRGHLKRFQEGRSYIEKPLIKDKMPEK